MFKSIQASIYKIRVSFEARPTFEEQNKFVRCRFEAHYPENIFTSVPMHWIRIPRLVLSNFGKLLKGNARDLPVELSPHSASIYPVENGIKAHSHARNCIGRRESNIQCFLRTNVSWRPVSDGAEVPTEAGA